MRLDVFYKELVSQARPLARGLGKCLHCGVWEADEGGVQGPWGNTAGTTHPQPDLAHMQTDPDRWPPEPLK